MRSAGGQNTQCIFSARDSFPINSRDMATPNSRARSRKVQVHFFRVVVDNQHDPAKILDVKRAHERLENFDTDLDPRARDYASEDGYTFIGSSKLMGVRLRFTLARELPNASPTVEEKGEFRVVRLGGGQRWVAPIDCVFFSDKCLLGAIQTVEGPRAFQVSRYLEDKLRVANSISCELLVRPDIRTELTRLNSIRKLELQFYPGNSPNLFGFPLTDVDNAMRSLSNVRDAAKVTLIIDAGLKDGSVLRKAKELLLKALESGSLVGSASVLRVVGRAPDRPRMDVPLDLLTSAISASKIVELSPGAKYLDQEAAYRAIEEAYAERLTEFPSVRIDGA